MSLDAAKLIPASLSKSQVWAISEEALGTLVQRIEARTKQLDNQNARDFTADYARTSHKFAVDANGHAQIDLTGTMLPEADWMLDYFQEDYTVTGHFADAIRAADANPAVKAITLNVNSPGGSVTGLSAAYEAVRDAKKPVMVVVQGMAASAAYYTVAAADQIIAQPESIVGSIGTMLTIYDVSGLMEKYGIKAHLVASGPDKGTGTPGVPVTEERLKPYRDMVAELAGQFKAAVSEGRSLTGEALNAIATGAAWVGPQAQAKGLVDKISTNPPAQAAHAHKEKLMLSKEQYKALVAANPAHADLINKMDAAGDDESAVKAAIAKASAKATEDRVVALEADLVKAKADAETVVKAEETAHAATKKERDDWKAKFESLNGRKTSHADPGAGNTPMHRSKMTMAEKSAFITAHGRAAYEALPN